MDSGEFDHTSRKNAPANGKKLWAAPKIILSDAVFKGTAHKLPSIIPDRVSTSTSTS